MSHYPLNADVVSFELKAESYDVHTFLYAPMLIYAPAIFVNKTIKYETKINHFPLSLRVNIEYHIKKIKEMNGSHHGVNFT